MRLCWKLAWTYAVCYPRRMLLAALAIVAAAGMVIWVVSNYDALLAQFAEETPEYLGRYDFFLVPESFEPMPQQGEVAAAFIPHDLLEKLSKDADVAEVDASLQWPVQILPDRPEGLAGQGVGARTFGPGGAGRGMGPGSSGRPGMGPPRGGDQPGTATPTQAAPRGVPGGASGFAGNAAGQDVMAGPGEFTSAPPTGGGRPGGSPRSPGAGGAGRRRLLFAPPKLIGTSAAASPYPVVKGRWIDPSDSDSRSAVITQPLAEILQVQVGDRVKVVCGERSDRFEVVGIIQQVSSAPTQQKRSPTGRPVMSGPGTSLGPATTALYVSLTVGQQIAGQGDVFNLLSIRLNEGVDVQKFHERWIGQLASAQPPLLLVGSREIHSAMEESMWASNARQQAWSATGLALLAGLFIIFTTLSMGVTERIRQFAMLRALGVTRSQVALAILIESLLLGAIGWAGGLVAGWGLLQILHWTRPAAPAGGATLGPWCVILSGLSALGGALLAAIVPAYQATRVPPGDVLALSRSAMPRLRWLLLLSLLGLILIAINPLLVYGLYVPDLLRYVLYAAIGCTSMALGFLALAPLAVVLFERVLGPLVAWLLRLEPSLLRYQLSSHLGRTLGSTLALCLGLGLYASMMVWGYSMLEPFKPGKWVPDVLVAFQRGGLPESEIETIRHTPGVIADQCFPLAVEQPRLAQDITNSQLGSSVTRQDNVIFVGLDPQRALGGRHPLLKLDFVQGNPQEAIQRLQEGRFCLVPDHFLSATGLKVGDRFAVVPPNRPTEPVEYTIAGAVSLPGWHWMTKFSGLRRRSGRSAALIFAPYEQVRQDFQIDQINFVWFNRDRSVPIDEIGEALAALAARYPGPPQPVNQQGTWAFAARTYGPSVRMTLPEDITNNIVARSNSVIWSMCELPLLTLIVTSLGVVNTVMASVRARRWELGVLRAVGLVRSALFRTILAEGVMIGLVACGLSLAFGILAGWCGIGISQYVSFFGGIKTPLIVPWTNMAGGFALALGLCLAGALGPALSAAYQEPLLLLQEGRAAL